MENEIDLQSLYSKEKCFWCEGPMFERAKLEQYPYLLKRWAEHIRTRDHLIPRKDGGVDFTVPSCYRCNHKKGALDPMKFRDRFMPHVPVEKVVAALLQAKVAIASVTPPPKFRKKRMKKKRRVLR